VQSIKVIPTLHRERDLSIVFHIDDGSDLAFGEVVFSGEIPVIRAVEFGLHLVVS